MSARYYDPQTTIRLSSDFDINLILREVDVIITDYSSVLYKAIYFDKSLVYYWPDHDKVRQLDMKVDNQFINNIAGTVTYNVAELIEAIEASLKSNYRDEWCKKYEEIRENIFDGQSLGAESYERIAQSLFGCIESNSYKKK
jgi:CDP-glycerol glycerophosphotransferase (TagB/SpsB family)